MIWCKLALIYFGIKKVLKVGLGLEEPTKGPIEGSGGAKDIAG